MLQEDPPEKSRSSPPSHKRWVAPQGLSAAKIQVSMVCSASCEAQPPHEEDDEFYENIIADPDKGILQVVAFAQSVEGSLHD